MKKLKYLILAGIALASTFNTVHAQELDKAKVQELVNNKQFVFKAQTAYPLSGSARQLSSDYDLKLIGDSMIAYLPYFGRAYTSTYGAEGGIKFTSTAFDYKAQLRKKGVWEIKITPKDTRDVREMNLTVSENGYASLQVGSNSRQGISFNGYITEVKK